MYAPPGSTMDTIDGTDRIYIGLKPGTDDDVVRDIILHESDHCIMFEIYNLNEYEYASNKMKYELEADRYAANKLCQMGYDGKAIARKTLETAYNLFGYTGDEDHGTAEQRIKVANSAPACAERQM